MASSEISQPSCAVALWLEGSNEPSACAKSRRRANGTHSLEGSNTLLIPSFSKRPSPASPRSAPPSATRPSLSRHIPGAITPAEGTPAAASLAMVCSSQRVFPIWTPPVRMKSTILSSPVHLLIYALYCTNNSHAKEIVSKRDATPEAAYSHKK